MTGYLVVKIVCHLQPPFLTPSSHHICETSTYLIWNLVQSSHDLRATLNIVSSIIFNNSLHVFRTPQHLSPSCVHKCSINFEQGVEKLSKNFFSDKVWNLLNKFLIKREINFYSSVFSCSINLHIIVVCIRKGCDRVWFFVTCGIWTGKKVKKSKLFQAQIVRQQ